MMLLHSSGFTKIGVQSVSTDAWETFLGSEIEMYFLNDYQNNMQGEPIRRKRLPALGDDAVILQWKQSCVQATAHI